jgi:shikimate dehydrogenase
VPTAKKHAEVWGSPIAHSLSPTLHRAAYAELGLPWSYDKREVTEETLAETWNLVAPEIHGLSLTMPLKEAILGLVDDRSPVVDLLGAANTVYRTPEGFRLDNTDPWGVIGALREVASPIESAWILGAGATARSVAYALSLLGTTQSVVLVVRSTERAQPTRSVVEALGIEVSVVTSDEVSRTTLPDLVINTLPGSVPFPFSDDTAWLTDSTPLFDVAYSPWPSAAAKAWAGSPHTVVSGLSMLTHQALRQVRLFVTGDPETEVVDESRVLAAMARSVS